MITPMTASCARSSSRSSGLASTSVDILFAHDVDIFTHGTEAARDRISRTLMEGGYKALVKLREEKVIKAFGAGVNEWQVCETMAERGDFDLFLLAGRYTLLEQEALESFLPLCVERGIGIVLGGPYNSGILATAPSRAPNTITTGAERRSRSRRADRGGGKAAQGETGRGGAAISAHAPRRGDCHPRCREPPRGNPQREDPGRQDSRKPCGRTSRPRA